jgi:hypothetical protein
MIASGFLNFRRCCALRRQGKVKEGINKKDISNSFWKMSVTSGKNNMSCSAAQFLYTTRSVPLSATL